MKTIVQSWRLACAIAGVSMLCLVGFGQADDKKDKDPKAKSNIIEVDLSKLPPEVAKQVLEALKKNEVKPVSLIEAITSAEKAGKGQATKAERKGEGADAQFKVDVVLADGSRIRITLNAAGKVLENEPAPKGKGKGPEKKE
jgi:uncharacterized membrane protein YkoI